MFDGKDMVRLALVQAHPSTASPRDHTKLAIDLFALPHTAAYSSSICLELGLACKHNTNIMCTLIRVVGTAASTYRSARSSVEKVFSTSIIICMLAY